MSQQITPHVIIADGNEINIAEIEGILWINFKDYITAVGCSPNGVSKLMKGQLKRCPYMRFNSIKIDGKHIIHIHSDELKNVLFRHNVQRLQTVKVNQLILESDIYQSLQKQPEEDITELFKVDDIKEEHQDIAPEEDPALNTVLLSRVTQIEENYKQLVKICEFLMESNKKMEAAITNHIPGTNLATVLKQHGFDVQITPQQ